MADDDTPATETPAKKPARRRATTPAKAKATASRTPRGKPMVEAAAGKKAKGPLKPRSSKRTAVNAAKDTAEATGGRLASRWGTAAIAGGFAAAGAVAAAALLSLRGSTAKPGDPAATPPKPGPEDENSRSE